MYIRRNFRKINKFEKARNFWKAEIREEKNNKNEPSQCNRRIRNREE